VDRAAEKANELLAKDASLMHAEARPFSHYPGGHPEGYSEGPRNLFGNVYRYIAEGAVESRGFRPSWMATTRS